jgi:hypothetical protein
MGTVSRFQEQYKNKKEHKEIATPATHPDTAVQLLLARFQGCAILQAGL